MSFEFRDFPNHEGIPYAILSHTWAEEGVLFQDIDGFNAATMPPQVKQKLGYKKIEACCAQAARDGFEHVWIDTCCIDKRSSAELSEAINSMYRWYQDCTVCYAYLADVPSDASLDIRSQKFRESRWFTRGWTLQELIGPLNLEFYGDQWNSKGQGASLGTKRSLQTQICEITGIPEDGLLSSEDPLREHSIAQRMSWAANRETTRIEDRAYSLLGLFNVNMPLLYGEGKRAFIRLQEEIMKVSTDETLFAWRLGGKETAPIIFQGLLAMSPDCFANSGRIIETVHNPRVTPWVVTNKGLQLEVMLPKASRICEASSFRNTYGLFDPMYLAVLNCIEEESGRIGEENPSGKTVGILLGCWGENGQQDEFVRIDSKGLVFIDPRNYTPADGDRTTIVARLAEIYDPDVAIMDLQGRHLDLGTQHRTVIIREAPSEFRVVEGRPKDLWSLENNSWVGRLEANTPPQKGFGAIELLFNNGVDAFVVCFESSEGPPWIQVQRRGVGYSLEKGIVPLEFPFERGISDRATCKLESGRVVSVSVRPERFRGVPCYALHVCIDKSSR
jgi:hypothetical protein